jgi:hypothetical protein
MPITDLATRFQDTYRIRLGDQQPDRNGKMRPAALTDRIRITAAGPEAPEAFVAVYGSVDNQGVQPWEDERTNDRFEAYLPVSALPIWIMPGQVLTQWWEIYAGKVCRRRCDGELAEVAVDVPGSNGRSQLEVRKMACQCPSPPKDRAANREECSPMSRLSVMCPEVEAVLGSGSLVTHSLIAAETFPAAMWLAGPWLSKNVPVAAVLRTITHKGRTTFTFPTIEVGGPVDRTPELVGAAAPALGGSVRAIGAGEQAPAQTSGGGAGGSSAAQAPPGPLLPRLPTGGVDWRHVCKQHGITQGDLLRQAQEFARGRDVPAPETLAEITDEQVIEDLREWLS